MHYAHHCGSEGSNLRRWLPRSCGPRRMSLISPRAIKRPHGSAQLCPVTSHRSLFLLADLIVMAETSFLHFCSHRRRLVARKPALLGLISVVDFGVLIAEVADHLVVFSPFTRIEETGIICDSEQHWRTADRLGQPSICACESPSGEIGLGFGIGFGIGRRHRFHGPAERAVDRHGIPGSPPRDACGTGHRHRRVASRRCLMKTSSAPLEGCQS
jgi:hypothetical protein